MRTLVETRGSYALYFIPSNTLDSPVCNGKSEYCFQVFKAGVLFDILSHETQGKAYKFARGIMRGYHWQEKQGQAIQGGLS